MNKYGLILGGLLALVLITIGGAWLYGQQMDAPHVRQGGNVASAASPTSTTVNKLELRGTPIPNVAQVQHGARPAATAPTPTVGTPTTTTSYIVVNTPTTVTITIQISPTPMAGGVNLLRLGATGTQATILGVMHDDGKNGDAVAGDGIYTLPVVFNESTAGQIQLEASIAFQGLLKRVVSNIMILNVFSAYTDSIVGVTVQYPPALSIVAPPSGISQQFILQSTPQLLALGESFGNTSSTSDVATDGYAITVSSSIYTPAFDVTSWLANVMPDYDVDTVTPTSVIGNSAYAITFDDIHVPKPLIVIPHGSMVYTVSYTSTFDPGTPEEGAGLAIFYEILEHIQFLK